MNALLHDLLHHQLWADAELWNASGAHEPARHDAAIRERFHHIHQVQRFFIWATLDRANQPALTKPGDFASFEDLRQYARETHKAITDATSALNDAQLAESLSVPWFKDPPLTITVAEALTQMAMHSQHHRGQNVTRLRELGATPPMIDLIVWYWKGRPAPSWRS
jgi:uncharacterized damage-inducible protein DinB